MQSSLNHASAKRPSSQAFSPLKFATRPRRGIVPRQRLWDGLR